MTVDTEKYLDFVDGGTSDPSKDFAQLLRRMTELDVEDDCEQNAQEDIVDSGQEEEYNNEEKKFKKNFDGFKFN